MPKDVESEAEGNRKSERRAKFEKSKSEVTSIRPKTWRSGPRGGFTLVELMVVLALIGILTVMILPEMRGTFEDSLLRSSSRKLIDVFSLASSEAVSRNQTHRVVIDLRTGRYRLERRVVERGQEGFVPLPDLAGSEGSVDSRIAVRFVRPGEESTRPEQRGSEPQVAADRFDFYPDGTAEAGMILLRDRAGFQLGLKINGVTGRVSVSTVKGERGEF